MEDFEKPILTGFAKDASKTGEAGTLKLIDSIRTSTTVLARITGTLIDVWNERLWTMINSFHASIL